MCGSYTLHLKPVDLQRELRLDALPTWAPRYNLRPTQAAPIVLDRSPAALTLARWGLVPPWAKRLDEGPPLFNARVETLSEKPAFKEALQHRRALVPCDGFFEWRHEGKRALPHYVRAEGGGLLTMAGLWSAWRAEGGAELTSFTIITTEADAFMRPIHGRMPVFIAPTQRQAWLGGAEARGLLTAWSGSLSATEVSPRVNSAANDDAECIAPAPQAQLSLL
jgi:putative SOS response-associated peptidase YedK